MTKKELIQALVGFSDDMEIIVNSETIPTFGITRVVSVSKELWCEDTDELATNEEYEEMPDEDPDPMIYIKKDFVEAICINCDTTKE